MKVLLGFLVGVACGAALLFQLMRSGWFAPDRVVSPSVATAVETSPAPSLTTVPPVPPVPAAATVPLPVRAPAAELRVASPSSTAGALAVSMPLPTAVAASQFDAAGNSSLEIPADVPAMAVNGLLIPVQGVQSADLRDTFTQARSADRVHDAIDIMAARGTPVLAANAGRVVKLFTSKPGGLTVYQFDPSEHVIYYYAHLDSYAPGLAEGQLLQRGDVIGTVGSTGNASTEAPHLHFEVQLLGPQKQWWQATSINPYGRFAGQR